MDIIHEILSVIEPMVMHICGDCGEELTHVRPGKYQCDNPKCKSNKQLKKQNRSTRWTG